MRLTETYPRAYSYTTKEDASVREFLLTSDLRGVLHLPLSVKAHGEVRQMQNDTADTDVSEEAKDRWVYTWGAVDFKASAYYAFYFKDRSSPSISFDGALLFGHLGEIFG